MSGEKVASLISEKVASTVWKENVQIADQANDCRLGISSFRMAEKGGKFETTGPF
jgi:hypothetical protein